MSQIAPFTVHDFQAKWRNVTLKESASSREHFTDLCRVVGVKTPVEADPAGQFYAFERHVRTTDGGRGFADVWYRGHFAWEYKGKHANLTRAYRQLQRYREALENPPLLIVSDLDHIDVHTNFTSTPPYVYELDLDHLHQPSQLETLRAVFTAPHSLRPGESVEAVTTKAAARFATLAIALEARGFDSQQVAHFLVQILFCLFAEDVDLLPKGVFTRILETSAERPERFAKRVTELFETMRDGGDFGAEEIAHFNGGLFERIEVVSLTKDELWELRAAAELEWGGVEPAIFGTLFERSLDPAKRRQWGMHYTSRADIERVIEPILLAPLRRRWAEVQSRAQQIKSEWQVASDPGQRTKRRNAFRRELTTFQEELRQITILDPACGSGNFLYAALKKVMDLEKEVSQYGAENGLSYMFPQVRPTQLRGLEINEYARELAQVVVWIGYLQWMRQNGFQPRKEPVLEAWETIRLQDALLHQPDTGYVSEAMWPNADFIVGNPPFLGGWKLREELGDDYVAALSQVFRGRVPGGADIVCYFFERARTEIGAGRAKRAGLLATNSIRGGANRRVLDRIKESGDICMAWADEPWLLDGARVRISIVGFDDGSETVRTLNGAPVATINSDLTGTIDVTVAERLPENRGISFTGIKKTGRFEVPGDLAAQWLAAPLNPNNRSNRDVLRLIVNGHDLTRRNRNMWIVDFGVDMSEDEAAFYELPFEHVKRYVKPERDRNREPTLARLWWLHARPRPEMRAAFAPLRRYIATTIHAQHRVFVWLKPSVLPDHALAVFARDDDYFFGVLHSRAHEVWSLRLGTSLEDRPRYTPTTCFDTFPFPGPTDEQRDAIAGAAKELDERRRVWLDPPGADEATLRTRTLTTLYNQRPTWLVHLHATLDRAVWTAFGWEDENPASVPDDAILARLLGLNLERSGEPSSARTIAPGRGVSAAVPIAASSIAL